MMTRRRVGRPATAFLLSMCLLSAEGAGVGQRFNLSSALQLGTGQFAQLFVPDYCVGSTNSAVTLVLHLHGSSGAAEDMIYKPRANAILFNLHLNGLSGVYQTYFADQTKFPAITNLVLEVLRTNNIVANARMGKLVLTSFSAGYAGLREILKSPANYERTDAILLADSLYSSSDPASRSAQMRDFLQFAADARDWRKIFLITHSSVATSGYDSTVQTADYLVSGIDRSWIAVSATDAIGTQYRQCDAGNLQIKGYLGDTATDHTRHFQNMDSMMARLAGLMARAETEFRFTSISRLSENRLELALAGASGSECVVERSADFTNWAPFSIVAANTNPSTLLDTVTAGGNRFYKARVAALQTVTQFESYSPGAVVMFQSPLFSGSTSGFLDTAAATFFHVTNVFPAGGANSLRVLQANWTFKAGQVNPWLRLTTYNTSNLPNPAISLTGALRFDIYSTRDIYVALGVRETDTTAAIGTNGGISGAIEWIGGSTQNSSPPQGRLVSANTWTQLVYFIPHEPIGSFAGNGVLNSSTGRGTLEHLAIVPAGGAGAYSLYLDNFQVIE